MSMRRLLGSPSVLSSRWARKAFSSVASADVDVHPTALVAPGAKIGTGCKIGPYCIVGDGVSLGRDVELRSHVQVQGRTQLGGGCVVFPFAVLGEDAQILQKPSNNGSRSWGVCIGEGTVVREHVTIHASASAGVRSSTSAIGATEVGSRCLLQSGSHIGHDCVVGDGVVLGSGSCLAGHVVVGDRAIIGGMAGVRQRVTVGTLAMVGGGSVVQGDVIPFGLVAGNSASLQGINLVGLRRWSRSQQLTGAHTQREHHQAEEDMLRHLCLPPPPYTPSPAQIRELLVATRAIFFDENIDSSISIPSRELSTVESRAASFLDLDGGSNNPLLGRLLHFLLEASSGLNAQASERRPFKRQRSVLCMPHEAARALPI